MAASDITFQENLYDYLFAVFGEQMEALGLESQIDNMIYGVLEKFDEQIEELEGIIKEEIQSLIDDAS
jgi:hypothetical protein